MKQHTTKKAPKTYSFEEYTRRFPTPSSPNQDQPIEEDLSELGTKLAEKSLAKVRQEARRSS